ncbi:MAG: hypothetical protein ACE5OZ_00235 [Candidatus Heimdallarchaeota archaeon]
MNFQITMFLAMFLFAPGWAFFANFPDEFDRLSCAGLEEGPIDHCRHPLTHHPLTIGYWLVPLLIPASQYTKLLQLAVFFLPPDNRPEISSGFVFYTGMHLMMIWGSHLFLDALNPSGLPTGRKSVYAPRPLRHYAWKELRPNVRSWRMAYIRFDDEKWNQILSVAGLAVSIIVITNELFRRTLFLPA